MTVKQKQSSRRPKRKASAKEPRVGRVAQVLRVIIEGGLVRVGYVDDKNRYHTGVVVSESAYRRLPKGARNNQRGTR